MGDAGKLMIPVLLIGYVVAFIVQLAGISAVQNVTNSYALSLQWFILILQLILIIMIPMLSVMGVLRRFRVTLIGLLAIVSTIWLYSADTAYKASRGPGGNDSRWNTLVAGCSLLFIFNVFAMFLIDMEGSDDSVVVDAPTKGASVPPPVTVVNVPESKGSPGAVSV